MKIERKSIPSYEGLYEVSNVGEVRTLEREWVSGRGITRRVKPALKSRTNNRLNNLAYGTVKENAIDRHNNTTIQRIFIPEVWQVKPILWKHGNV